MLLLLRPRSSITLALCVPINRLWARGGEVVGAVSLGPFDCGHAEVPRDRADDLPRDLEDQFVGAAVWNDALLVEPDKADEVRQAIGAVVHLRELEPRV